MFPSADGCVDCVLAFDATIDAPRGKVPSANLPLPVNTYVAHMEELKRRLALIRRSLLDPNESAARRSRESRTKNTIDWDSEAPCEDFAPRGHIENNRTGNLTRTYPPFAEPKASILAAPWCFRIACNRLAQILSAARFSLS
jgi:hypothetical protein